MVTLLSLLFQWLFWGPLSMLAVMSLFPFRLKPGGTLTLHLRSEARFPVWVQKRSFMVGPDGGRTLLEDKLAPYLPVPQAEADVEVMDRVGEVFIGTPILMAANYLQREKANTDFFLRILKGLKNSTHTYSIYTVPTNAKLGKYVLELEASANGETSGSSTSATDYFYVEELFLREVHRRENGGVAAVENPSPEPVLAILCECDPTQPDPSGWKTKLVGFPPKTTTQIEYHGTAMLAYCEGTEMMSLQTPGDPFCLRNPRLPVLPKGNGTFFVFKTQVEKEEGFMLEGAAAEVWRLANGFRTRGQVLNEENAAAYQDLLAKELILEVTY